MSSNLPGKVDHLVCQDLADFDLGALGQQRLDDVELALGEGRVLGLVGVGLLEGPPDDGLGPVLLRDPLRHQGPHLVHCLG